MSKKMLKRSLALGALMAFVITGSAWADITVDDQGWVVYHQLGGTPDTVDANDVKGNNDRVVGGWSGSNSNLMTNEYSTNLTVNGGNWTYVIGGSYFSSIDTDLHMNIGTTKVTVNNNAFIRHLVGGTSSHDIGNLTTNEDRTAQLIINGKGATFGKKSDWTENTLESLVVGGDHIKNDAVADNNNKCNVKLTSTLTQIEGGTFESLVIGGSLANQFYAKVDSEILNTYVGKAETIINGGTFNKPIVAGGVAIGTNAISDVGEAVLNISNATVNATIFTGGMVRYIDANGDYGATVGKSTVVIKDSIISNVYNTRGFCNWNTTDVDSDVLTGWYFDVEDESTSDKYFYPADKGADEYAEATTTDLTLINTEADIVNITLGSVTLGVAEEGNTSINTLSLGDEVGLAVTVDGTTNDAIGGDTSKIANYITIENAKDDEEVAKKLAGQITTVTLEAGDATDKIILTSDGKGGFTKDIIANKSNTGISDINSVALMSWRAETNDMNKRLGELRNANGEHGVWVRMVRGESEYNSVNHQYNQYQLGYDEKLSVDPSWTVGAAYTYTDAESSFSKGSGENTHKGVAIYGSKLNDDGSFVDLIAKYSRLEHDFDLGTAKGDYDTNGYSVSAEYGKRFQQGNGLWIEPQVELTYGQVDSATYMVGGRTVNQDSMESLVGRVGFSLGKDISKGNVYVRASYLYDFEGETSATYTKGGSQGFFEQDLGGGWWEVGVGANINLSKATYIYADVEKTFGGEVDTNWQWNLGVRYSF